MLTSIIDIFTKIADWLQEKLKTKFGFFIMGALFSFLIVFSFFENEHKMVEELKGRNEVLMEKLDQQRDLTKEWQDRWVESEQGSMEKLKNMMEFLNELENTYNQRYENQSDKNTEISSQLSELRSINSRLKNLENQTTQSHEEI